MFDSTTIRISKETKETLDRFGQYKDNYDDIIQRVIAQRADFEQELKQLRKVKRLK